MWARSWIPPEQDSFLNIEIMCIVSFCSSKWIVLAVVTRFFTSVLVWIFAISSDMSIHNPQRNWHELKHFMKEYSSATAVESTVFLIFWLSYSIRLPHDIPSFDIRPRGSAKNTVMPFCEDPSLLFRWKAPGNPIILNGPVSGQN